MSKIYVMDYGLSICHAHSKINELLESKGWKRTGFNTTYWKDIEGKCDVRKTENDLRELIKERYEGCIVTLLIVCVEKSDVIGTNSNGIVFGCDFKYPQNNNIA